MKRVDVAYVLLYDETTDKVLMVKNIGKGESYFTLPGGAVESGETLEQAAIREAKEETGLDVIVEGIFSITEALFEESEHHAVFYTFIGKIVSGDIHISYPDEIEEVTWMDCTEAEKNYLKFSNGKEGMIRRQNTVPYRFKGKVSRGQ